MKYILFFSLVIFSFSCMNMDRVKGSGNIISEKRSIGAFSSVHAEGSVHVIIKNSTEQSVSVEADDNVIKYVETTLSGGTLKVRLKEHTSFSDITVNVYVTAPSFIKLYAEASADIDAKDVITSAGEMTLAAGSSGKIELKVDAPAVKLDAESSGDVIVSGRTKTVHAEASSSGSVQASGLKAEIAEADAESSGDIEIFASISLKASASSSGDIRYSGGAPEVRKTESSSGSVSAQ